MHREAEQERSPQDDPCDDVTQNANWDKYLHDHERDEHRRDLPGRAGKHSGDGSTDQAGTEDA